ncbi:type II toxin-antitoxin system HipA family toxin [Terasakiella pusilla]|uniref:type II toxin-antitoxin system HipA family toxin n=1 Tax=Terasakiella pusilla TaxID=64973 RepID=UPI00048C3B9F|nr:HipA domain-containing protein [Terasakiella pusilla]
MADILDVYLHQKHVGEIISLSNERSLFNLLDSYTEDEKRSTLSLSFLRANNTVGTSGKPRKLKVEPFFSNLLPEGRLREYIAETNKLSPKREFHLLNVLGHDLPGGVVVKSRAELTDEVAELNDEAKAGTYEGEMKFSLAGVQMKMSAIKDAAGGLTVPAHGLGGAWILKFASERFQSVPENEFWMMTFAQRLGFDVPEIELLETHKIGGLPEGLRSDLGRTFAIRRFDRTDHGRVHIEDFAQVFGIWSSMKYDRVNHEMIGRVLAEQVGMDGVLEYVRRLVFSMGIGNGDMHAKNWSLIYQDQRTPTLAPMYDYLSTLTYEAKPAFALNFADRKTYEDFDIDSFKQFADALQLPSGAIVKTAKEMAEKIADFWATLKTEVDLPEFLIAAISDNINSIPLFKKR